MPGVRRLVEYKEKMISMFLQTKLYRLILSLCLLISFFASSVYSQEYQRQDDLPSLPPHVKEHLINRLNTFVTYYRNKQFDMVYEMLSREYREGMTNIDGTHPNKQEWIKGQEEWSENVGNRGIVEFRLERAFLIVDSWEDGLELEGCVQFDNSNDRYKYETHAIYEGGEWYFWDIVQYVSCVKCKPERCGESANSQ